MSVELTDRVDASAFLERLLRLEPAALVRLRPAGPDRVALWAQLPWGVLVTRTVAGQAAGDGTTTARALLDGVAQLPARDADWRLPLPPSGGRAVEALPEAVVRRVAVAAAESLRAVEAGGLHGRAIGRRAVRDALLDHIAISGTSDLDGTSFEVPQRLVQAVVRMGFLAGERVTDQGSPVVTVVAAGPWTGLAAPFGTAWFRPAGSLNVRPISTQPIG